jgi:hypothetical protein
LPFLVGVLLLEGLLGLEGHKPNIAYFENVEFLNGAGFYTCLHEDQKVLVEDTDDAQEGAEECLLLVVPRNPR